jgi:phage terminase large subunit GpA-like protein
MSKQPEVKCPHCGHILALDFEPITLKRIGQLAERFEQLEHHLMSAITDLQAEVALDVTVDQSTPAPPWKLLFHNWPHSAHSLPLPS